MQMIIKGGKSPQTPFPRPFHVPIQQEAPRDGESGSLSYRRGSFFKAARRRAYQSSLEGHLDHMLLTASAASQSEGGNKGPLSSLLSDAQTQSGAAPLSSQKAGLRSRWWQDSPSAEPRLQPKYTKSITSLAASLLMTAAQLCDHSN